MTREKAKLFYAVKAPDGALLLNIQTEAGEFSQIEMTRNQLAGLLLDAVKMLLLGDAAHDAGLTSPKRGNGSGALNQPSERA